MCYSAESSITSFLIGGLLSLYLIFYGKNNTNKHIGLFFFSVSLMQLAEYLMWIDQKCGWKNEIASRSILLILILQIYSLFLGAYIYQTTIIPNNILKLILIIITPLTLYYGFENYFEKNKKWCSKPNEDKSLQWPNHKLSIISTSLYYFIFLSFPFIMKELWKSLIVLLFGLITYFSTRYKNKFTSDSRWCYFSSFGPIIFILFDYFNK